MLSLPQPPSEAIIFENKKLYACLASHPLAEGHVVVVWKKNVQDLHFLLKSDYKHLMDVVDIARNAMMKALDVEKVYLVYMDEAKHVHWHLVPRYNEKGVNVLAHEPGELKNFRLAKSIKAHWQE